MTTIEQLAAFHQFALQQLQSGNDLSIQDMLSIWQDHYLTEDELRESLKAVKEALNEFENGDRGTPLEEYLREFKEEHKISST